LNRSQLLLIREGIQPTSRPDVDETLYLIAGEAVLTISGKDQTLTAGWFGLVPRGSTYQVTRKGRNPAILLSVIAGLPCGGGSTNQ
jgi:mannose-6-phosphate isomerase-like protein (cupin superfamily)